MRFLGIKRFDHSEYKIHEYFKNRNCTLLNKKLHFPKILCKIASGRQILNILQKSYFSSTSRIEVENIWFFFFT